MRPHKKNMRTRLRAIRLRARMEDDDVPDDVRALVYAHLAALRVQHAWTRRVRVRAGDHVHYASATWRVDAVEDTARVGGLWRAYRISRMVSSVSWAMMTTWVYDRTCLQVV